MKISKKIIPIACLVLFVAAAVFVLMDHGKTEEPEASDICIWYPSGYELLHKQTLNDVEVIRQIEEKLDVPLYFTGTSGDLDSAFSVVMGDLEGTDAVFYRFDAGQLRSSYENGQILDYREYLDRMPNLSRLFEENPLLYQYACVDGHCLLFPSTLENAYEDVLLAVRSDWKEQAGYTRGGVYAWSLAELEQMFLKQKLLFEEKRLAPMDEYFVGLSSYNGFIEHLLPLYKTSAGLYWNQDRDGLIYGPSTEEYRRFLTDMKRMYQEGLLDSHIYDSSDTNFEKYLLNSTSSAVLATSGQIEKLEGYAAENGDSLPLEYINLYSMAGEEAVLYDAKGRKDRVLEFGFVINSDIGEEKLEKLLRFIDYLYSDEGMEYTNWGEPGRHYEEQDGLRVYSPKLLKDGEYYGISMALYVKQDLLRTDRSVNLNMSSEKSRKCILLRSYEADRSFTEPKGYYSEEGAFSRSDLKTALESFTEETSMNFIFQSIDPSDDLQWQEYLDALYGLGLEQYLEMELQASERMEAVTYEK